VTPEEAMIVGGVVAFYAALAAMVAVRKVLRKVSGQ